MVALLLYINYSDAKVAIFFERCYRGVLNSVFNFYRKLIELRKNSPYQADLVCGDFRLLTDVDTNVIAYQRGKKLAIYINLSNKPIEAQLPIAKVILNNYPELDNTDQNTILQPYQAILVERSL